MHRYSESFKFSNIAQILRPRLVKPTHCLNVVIATIMLLVVLLFNIANKQDPSSNGFQLLSQNKSELLKKPWYRLGDNCYIRLHESEKNFSDDGSPWNVVQSGWYYSLDNDFACPVSTCRGQWRYEQNFTNQLIRSALKQYFKTNGNVIAYETHKVRPKYSRVSDVWGVEYRMNGEVSVVSAIESGAQSVENRNIVIAIRRGFANEHCEVIVDTLRKASNQRIYMVVPYTGRMKQLEQLYKNLRQLIDDGVNVRLILATYGGIKHETGARNLLRDMHMGLTEGQPGKGHVVQVVTARGEGSKDTFSRSQALSDGAQHVAQDGLVFMCDVDMWIGREFFKTCQYNARQGRQVYFPIVYSLHPYGRTISREHGYWRKSGFGMVCIYKSDLSATSAWKKRARQSAVSSGSAQEETGWGYEDVMLYSELNRDHNIATFRAVEPNLIHRWHPKYCAFNRHIASCLTTVFQNMGSQQFLATLVAKHGIDVRHIKYNPQPLVFPGVQVNESQSDQLQHYRSSQLKEIYESFMSSKRGGLLSVFQKEMTQQES